jgi:4-amino-4-deoxy-L-arabinose transferase-like glycosyltransferase
LLALTLVRLLVAGTTSLSPDEAYYWVWSRALAPGYLDHPPMVALWIRAGTAVLGDGALGVRLLAPLSGALGSILLAAAAEDLFPGRRLGVPAAALFNSTLLMGVGAISMTPDTPLVFFWTAALWGLARMLRTGRPGWWMVIGLASGGALTSKYTAVLLGLGVTMWLVADPAGRRWLRTPGPWLGAVIAMLCFAPVLGWNAAHDWASFAKQAGRTGDWHPAQAANHVLELVGGQLGLATPWVAVLCAVGIGLAVGRVRQGSAPLLLVALTLPSIAVFFQHALGDRVQANWPAIIYPAASIAAVAYVGCWWRPAAGLGFALTALVYVQAAAAPLRLPRQLDVTLIRLGGWDSLVARVAAEQAGFVAADNYGLASVLAHGLPGLVVGVEPRWDLFVLPKARIAGQTGLLVRSARRSGRPEPGPWQSVTPAGTITRSRNGVVAETYELYRVVAATDLVRLPNAR